MDDQATTIYRGPVPQDPDPSALLLVRGANGAMPTPAPPVESPATPALFRRQAVEAYQGAGNHGAPLRIVPKWMAWSVRLIGFVVVASIAFASVAEVSERAHGPAVVRIEGRRVIGSPSGGTVTAIEVSPGQRVMAGSVLIRLDDTRERADLARIEREQELLLARLLRDPRAATLRQQMAALDGDKQLAEARLAERQIASPQDGIASDVRVRLGQHVNPGDALIAVDNDESEVVVVAMLPGHQRPRLSEERPVLTLDVDGFSQSTLKLRLRSIADEVIGPEEALRFLGEEPGSINLRGPTVVVEATVDRRTFEADGDTFRLYDGMRGTLEAELGSETLLQMLLPSIKGLLKR